MTLDAHALHLVGLVEAERSRLADQIVVRLQKEIPAYANVASEELRHALEIKIAMAAQAIRREANLGPNERAALIQLGAARVQQGVSYPTLLRAIRLAAREALDFVQTLAADSSIDPASSITLAATLWDWVDDAVEQLGAGSDGDVRRIVEHALVSGIASGALSSDELAGTAIRCGLDPNGSYLVVRGRADDAALAALRPSRSGVVAAVDGEAVAVLTDRPPVPVPGVAGMSPRVPLAGAHDAYRLAGRIRETAEAFGWIGLFEMGDVGLRAALVHDSQVADWLDERYLAPVRALGPFGDELLTSLRTYFEHDQSVDDSARELFVHPNTLRHRLARFEEATGTSLRNVEKLAEIWCALSTSSARAARRSAPSGTPGPPVHP